MENPYEYLESAADYDTGRVRKNNEDNFGLEHTKGWFCVADGMGGEESGEVASQAVVDSIYAYFKDYKEVPGVDHFADKVRLARDAILEANRKILAFVAEKQLTRSGSTAAMLLFDAAHPSVAVALHAGDSRIYRIRNGKIIQVTVDHSVAAEAGVTNEKRLPKMFRGMITRAVGLKEQLEVEDTLTDVEPGDLFLLCSDGLSGMLNDKRIIKCLKKHQALSLDERVAHLIAEANEAGGKDNISVVLVEAQTHPIFDQPALPFEGLGLGPSTHDTANTVDQTPDQPSSVTAVTQVTRPELPVAFSEKADLPDTAPMVAVPGIEAGKRGPIGKLSVICLSVVLITLLITAVVLMKAWKKDPEPQTPETMTHTPGTPITDPEVRSTNQVRSIPLPSLPEVHPPVPAKTNIQEFAVEPLTAAATNDPPQEVVLPPPDAGTTTPDPSSQMRPTTPPSVAPLPPNGAVILPPAHHASNEQIKPIAEPGPEPKPAPVPAPEPIPEPEPAPKPVPEPKPAPEPVPAPDPEPEPAPKPLPKPEPAPEPHPVPLPAPAPKLISEPEPVAVPTPEPKLDAARAWRTWETLVTTALHTGQWEKPAAYLKEHDLKLESAPVDARVTACFSNWYETVWPQVTPPESRTAFLERVFTDYARIGARVDSEWATRIAPLQNRRARVQTPEAACDVLWALHQRLFLSLEVFNQELSLVNTGLWMKDPSYMEAASDFLRPNPIHLTEIKPVVLVTRTREKFVKLEAALTKLSEHIQQVPVGAMDRFPVEADRKLLDLGYRALKQYSALAKQNGNDRRATFYDRMDRGDFPEFKGFEALLLQMESAEAAMAQDIAANTDVLASKISNQKRLANQTRIHLKAMREFMVNYRRVHPDGSSKTP